MAGQRGALHLPGDDQDTLSSFNFERKVERKKEKQTNTPLAPGSEVGEAQRAAAPVHPHVLAGLPTHLHRNPGRLNPLSACLSSAGFAGGCFHTRKTRPQELWAPLPSVHPPISLRLMRHPAPPPSWGHAFPGVMDASCSPSAVGGPSQMPFGAPASTPPPSPLAHASHLCRHLFTHSRSGSAQLRFTDHSALLLESAASPSSRR